MRRTPRALMLLLPLPLPPPPPPVSTPATALSISDRSPSNRFHHHLLSSLRLLHLCGQMADSVPPLYWGIVERRYRACGCGLRRRRGRRGWLEDDACIRCILLRRELWRSRPAVVGPVWWAGRRYLRVTSWVLPWRWW